ncbi:FAD-binding and (Fe-S)-binding domain-containing protein [Tessaracoccus palaemonis]|uniref:D-lactate dehydrogenase (cytochrome) n=1 Tax=Tessaracoccus palaemonis TaxID=2829499 RepID=A0ABX8SJB5_9ACTN|nr:FAD-binding and (Fe-S)-binding domain-containing protein [Tessaracoccus palaemonis]QXT62552.1 FAD-binding oxidoreductase [Tessaracoccus palaemonis]
MSSVTTVMSEEAASAPITRDSRAITRLAMAHDASHFLLTPKEVITPTRIEDVAFLMSEAARTRRPMTFRSGGTSLSGQAVTDKTLVDTRRWFRDIEVLDEGRRVRAGVGATLSAVNARLAPYGRRLGPDPTSAIACTIGGIIANNSSGVLCGTTQNSYHTLESMVFALPSGRVVDTADPAADMTLRLEETHLVGGLHMLRKRLRTNPDSIAQVNHFFGMKNTMGYGINALMDFHRPVDIISHLLIGSEGTLGFVSEATFRTVPLPRRTAVLVPVFPDLQAAALAAVALADENCQAVELMDAATLRVLQHQPGSPDEFRDAEVTTQAALIVELHDEDDTALTLRLNAVAARLRALGILGELLITTDEATRRELLTLRRSLYALVAGVRPSGATTLLEDICVPLDQLPGMLADLDDMFDRHGYGVMNVPLFAHAKDGNVHFLLSERFDDATGLKRYRKFTREMVRRVLQRGGALKAEHGTGRAMAPFVHQQYGDELFEVMRAIKHLFDPMGILNPGVIITDDPDEHLRHLKLMPPIEESVDGCIECGFCESSCPSRDLTLTPRQRIVLRREIAARGDDAELLARVDQEYQYEAIDTCAVDSMCALACPLGIDTGALVRRQRADAATPTERTSWKNAARSWGLLTRLGSAALTVAKTAPPLARAATGIGRRALGTETVPDYAASLPRGSGLKRRPRRRSYTTPGVAAYFPSCLQSMLGSSSDEGVFAAFRELCLRAGVRVTLLDAADLCCGAPWQAKGMDEGYAMMRDRVRAAVDLPPGIPIVTDASSCTQSLRRMAEDWDVEVRDVVQFAVAELLPRLSVISPIASLAVHPTCSSTRAGMNDDLMKVARFISDDVHVPDSWACCGFAGDRGLLHPELTRSATREMAAELGRREYATYASLNRTCEIGMSQATGRTYLHILELLARATRPTQDAPARGRLSWR